MQTTVRSVGSWSARSETCPMARWTASGAWPAFHSSSSRTSSSTAPPATRRLASAGSMSRTGAGSRVTASRYRRPGGHRTTSCSTGEVHQLDPHSVGVGAVDDVEPGAPQIEGGPGAADDGPSQRLDQRGGGLDVVHPNREMGEAEPVHRAPVPVTGVPRGDERQELDGHAVPGEHPRFESHALDLHQGGELLPDLVGGDLFESEPLAVEAEGALEVRDADPHVRERQCHHDPSWMRRGTWASPMTDMVAHRRRSRPAIVGPGS